MAQFPGKKISELNAIAAASLDSNCEFVLQQTGINWKVQIFDLLYPSIVEESVTIDAAGAITVVSTAPFVELEIDTFGAAASDNLDTINRGRIGQVLYCKAANSARIVVCRDGIGNLNMAGNFSLDHIQDRLQLKDRHDSGASRFVEISRSNNA